jgi:Terminase large subunit, T4likevirus-type, N-terminal
MSKWVTRMTLEDAEHYTPEQRAAIISSYPEHERDARTKGVPQLGSGLVFSILDELISCDPIIIPKHWARINGLDFGWDHPFAAVSLAHDRDNDCVYVTNGYREAHSRATGSRF